MKLSLSHLYPGTGLVLDCIDSKNNEVAKAAIRSNAVVLLLMICCLMCFPMVVGVSVFIFVLLCRTLCHF